MMKTISLALLFCLPGVAMAQWTSSSGNTVLSTSTDKVGVGNGAPLFKLDVHSPLAGVAVFRSLSSGNTGNISFFNNSNWSYGVMGTISGTSTLGNDVYGLGWSSNANSSFNEVLTWNSSGKVGIGTTAPWSKFVVSSTNAGVAILGTSTTGNTGNLSILNGSNHSYGVMGVLSGTGGVGGDVFGLGYSPNANSSFTNVLAWTSSGRVGIGTASPDQKLTVKGIIHAEEVRVDLSVPGPDYVFAKDYHLPSIETVKTYIDKNQHLPGVPSAKEMEAEGIKVGEMNMLLLKKIEELTLYVIDLKEENKTMKKELSDLKSNK